MNNVKIFFSVLGLLVAAVVVTIILRSTNGGGVVTPGKYDTFATCLKDSGIVFYGAFWCPHCQAQKKLFGSSAKLLPYVECSTADANGQTQICKDKGITSYPTWILPDGTLVPNETDAGVTLATLGAKTSCALPVE
ncbi:MAG TPA: thioredoxin domain-containing protein [Candidatus Paceibacterota bacterium]